MVFTLTRDGGKKPALKTINSVNDNSLLNALLERNPAGSETIMLQTLKVGEVLIDNTVTSSLEKAIVTPGVAQSSKALVVDSSRNISGVNRITCSSIYIDNVLLDPLVFKGGAVAVSTADAARSELTGLVAGTASGSKALVLDVNKKVSGVNTLSVEAVETDREVIVNRKNNNVKLNTHDAFNSPYTKTIVTSSFGSYTTSSTNITTNIGPVWLKYAEAMETYIASFTDNVVRISKDLVNWTTVLSAVTISYVDYFEDTGKAVAVGNKFVYYSSDLYTWTTVKYSENLAYCVEYSPYLGLYIVAGFGVMWHSPNLDDWFACESPTNYSINHIKWIDSSKRFIGGTSDNTKGVIYSLDGKKWDVLPISAASNYYGIKVVEWSPLLNTVVLMSATNSVRASLIGYYSNDGGINFKPFYYYGSSDVEMKRVKWVPEINMFIGIGGTAVNLLLSQDGCNWKDFKLSTSGALSSFVLSPVTMNIYLFPSDSSSFYKVPAGVCLNAFKSPLWAVNNSKFSFNTKEVNSMLNIGSDNGKLMKLSHETRAFPSTISLSNGVVDISSSPLLNLNLNDMILPGNKLIKLNNFRFLDSLVSNYYYQPKDYLVAASSGAVNLPAYISVSSATVGGSAINIADNAPEFTGNQVGIATANKFMLADTNGAITEVKKLGAVEVRMGDFLLSGAQATVDIEKVTQKEVSVGACHIFNSFLTNTSLWGTHSTTDTPYYIKELDLLIVYRSSSSSILYKSFTSSFTVALGQSYTLTQLVGFSPTINNIIYVKETGTIYYLTTQGLFYTRGKDILSWKLTNFMSLDTNSMEDLSYSPELGTTVVATSGSIMISKNGIDFKSIPDNRYSDSIQLVKWVPAWSMFVAVARTQTAARRMFVSSKDGLFWDHQEYADDATIRSATFPSQLVYSPKLNMLIARSSTVFYYTNDGVDWKCSNHPSSVYNTTMSWIPELEIFISGSTTASTNMFSYSYDGFKWIMVKAPAGAPSATYSSFNKGVLYIKSQNMVIMNSTGTTAGIVGITCAGASIPHYNPNDAVVDSNMSLDIVNNRVGLGVSPQYSLHLSEDLAFKPTTSTWLTSSDRRLKEDIEEADYSKCMEAISSVPVNSFELNGEKQLGWVAQDVEDIIPKAVSKCNMYGLEDCRSLNNDQLIANMYGAVKWLIGMDKSLDNEYFEM